MSVYGSVLFTLLGELMGQPYDDPRYFWAEPSIPRESGTSSDPVNSHHELPKSASQRRIQLRLEALQREAPADQPDVPPELTEIIVGRFTPFIEPRTAIYQVPRVARNRGLPPAVLHDLIESHAEMTPSGERRVDVLRLNMALDDLRTRIRNNEASPAVINDRAG
jgi:potassium-transporting ATPase KdpC subunit